MQPLIRLMFFSVCSDCQTLALMSNNFFNLNESKTETIVFGPLVVSGSLNQVLGSLAYVKPPVKNMGVVFDSALLFDKQVNAVWSNHAFSS